MPHVRNRTAVARWGAILALIIRLTGLNADVISLKDGRQLGGDDGFAHVKAGNAVIVDASGISETIPLKDVISMKLNGPRKLELQSGDMLHGDNVVMEEGSVSFTSELLGQNAVPLAAVVAISAPAGKRIPETPPQPGQKPAPPPKKWKGNVQLGYASTSGREDTQNVNLGAEAVREAGKTRLTLKSAARYGESDGEKNVDAQEASGKLDFFMTDRLYLYSNLGALRDNINLIELRVSPGVGVGRKFVRTDAFSPEGEAGVTMIREWHILTSGEKDTETNWDARVAGRFTWKPGPWTEFSEELEVLPGLSSEDEFRYRSVSQLKATVTKKLSLAAGFTVNYDDNPPQDAPRTSTNASTGFIYNF